jgi:Fe-Mn family superoxide dismutase
MLEAKKFESIRELKGISEQTMTEHYKLYEGYIKKFNEITEKLLKADASAANPSYSELRSLKTEYSFALNGVKNHEIYFGHLGGDGTPPTGKLSEQLAKDFGSFEYWQSDMKATAMSARGWAWLVWDKDLNKLVNIAGDSQNTYLVWNCLPLVALDVYEHAYFIDYGVRRADYIEAFFANLNWSVIEQGFGAALKASNS